MKIKNSSKEVLHCQCTKSPKRSTGSKLDESKSRSSKLTRNWDFFKSTVLGESFWCPLNDPVTLKWPLFDYFSVNAQLVKQTHILEKQILDDQVERNRELNRAINKDYEEIGQRLEWYDLWPLVDLKKTHRWPNNIFQRYWVNQRFDWNYWVLQASIGRNESESYFIPYVMDNDVIFREN